MSRKERVVDATRVAIVAACAFVRRPLRAGEHRRGLAEGVLAGFLLAVAVAGAVLIPRLLVGPQPGHELGVGAPSMTVPPVVLAPKLPAQKSHPQPASSTPTHAAHLGVVPVAGASSPKAKASPTKTSPPTRQSPPATSQPPAQSQTQPQSTTRALVPAALAPGTTTCDGTYGGTGKEVVVPAGATCVLTEGTLITHDLKVSPGGTLIDPAVTVRHDLVAERPAGISIDGDSVGHNLRIEGLSGSAAGGNRICNTTVGHDLVVEGGLASAGPIAVGSGCSDGGNRVGHDLVVANNANVVTVAGNSVGHRLRVDTTAPAPPAPKPKSPRPRREKPAKPTKPHPKPNKPSDERKPPKPQPARPPKPPKPPKPAKPTQPTKSPPDKSQPAKPPKPPKPAKPPKAPNPGNGDQAPQDPGHGKKP